MYRLATIHVVVSESDRQTDGQTYDSTMPIADHTSSNTIS